ncbi:MAG: NCS2 family permease [Oscillibacter sp.]|jgi:AGZA family xanthine/uracil permease-like MFS transporter|nr:NCS2 family permease [Oscillibacter sp.]
MNIQDILAALSTVLNGIPQAVLALTYGFAAFPTALGFFIGCAGMLLFGQVAPISFQAESIVLAGTLGKNRSERLSIVLFAGILMAVLGAFGALNAVTGFIGTAILSSMMAGVGIMLAKCGIDMVKEDHLAGGVSFASGLIVYFLSKNLIYTVAVSVVISSVVWSLRNKQKNDQQANYADMGNERFHIVKPQMSLRLLRSVLAVCTLQIGGNIAYAGVTGQLAAQKVNVDFVTIYSGLADAASALFGGGPVEAIISSTGLAPHPTAAGVLMMLIMAIILLTKALPKIARYIPSQSIAGFLFILGAIVVFPSNALAGIQESSVVSGVTILVTATIDPFVGMISGVLVRAVTALL